LFSALKNWHGNYNHMEEKVTFNCGEFNDLESKLIKVLDKKKIPYYLCINKSKVFLLEKINLIV